MTNGNEKSVYGLGELPDGEVIAYWWNIAEQRQVEGQREYIQKQIDGHYKEIEKLKKELQELGKSRRTRLIEELGHDVLGAFEVEDRRENESKQNVLSYLEGIGLADGETAEAHYRVPNDCDFGPVCDLYYDLLVARKGDAYLVSEYRQIDPDYDTEDKRAHLTKFVVVPQAEKLAKTFDFVEQGQPYSLEDVDMSSISEFTLWINEASNIELIAKKVIANRVVSAIAPLLPVSESKPYSGYTIAEAKAAKSIDLGQGLSCEISAYFDWGEEDEDGNDAKLELGDVAVALKQGRRTIEKYYVCIDTLGVGMDGIEAYANRGSFADCQRALELTHLALSSFASD